MRLAHCLIPLFLFIVGCPKQTAVWLRPTPDLGQPSFVIGRTLGNESFVDWVYLRVDRCGSSGTTWGEPMWGITRPADSIRSPTRVTYGRVPSGFVEYQAAKALDVGCYSVSISGAGAAWFEIDSTGVARGVR